ncbi:addiction module toxin RelE [Hydrogenovibrio sp. SC-1]|uniref:type II toxin-antitoxin system RelE/ParE family toxin n=1 Tax=Hydrogenovibrio sp. SC-1 TaxID=2065820 RepID=UPI000C7D9C85|nr:type II toxin-antitoxin system RelE/ParE family toxin [Hydrogenovibrio sp. SC-1]PLA75029.1 addiction module toxin RelE [Hydrogenovibrio sp. SC-1]
MSSVKQVLQSPSFKKTVKKLHSNQKKDLDIAIKSLIEAPNLGEKKRGDLAYLRVYKFKMVKQEVLLGYSYQEDELVLELLALGSHENFYRDLKTNL